MKLLALIFLAFATSAYSFDFKTEFDHLKSIGQSLLQGQSPQSLIDNALKTHPQIQQTAGKVCTFVESLKFLAKIQPVIQKACDFIGSNAAPVQKRDISSIIANIQGKFSSITTNLQADLANFQTLAGQILGNIDAKTILQNIVNFNLPNKIDQFCSFAPLKAIEQVNTVCNFVEPYDGQLKQIQQKAEQYLQTGTISKRSILDNIKNDFAAIGGKIQADINNIKNGLLSQLHGAAAAAPAAPAAPAPVDAAPAADDAHPVQKRGFSLSNLGNLGNLFQEATSLLPADLSSQISGIAQIAQMVADKKPTGDIIQAALNLHLDKTIVALCNNSFVQSIPVAAQNCKTVTTVLQTASQFSSLLG